MNINITGDLMYNDKVVSEELSLIRKFTSEVVKYNDGISLAIGEPYMKVDDRIIERTKKSLDNNECGYTNAQGDIELIKSICEKEAVEESNVLVTYGSSEAIFISLLTLLNKDDEVIIIVPCYPQYAPVVKFCNGIIRYVETKYTGYVPTYDNIIKNINSRTKVIIINTPSNPTGLSYDVDTLQMIQDIAIKYDIFVISDDVYDCLSYGEKVSFKYNLDSSITLKSFSKTYGMTGYRLGYVISNNETIKQLLKVHSYLAISIPTFVQKGGVEALRCDDLNYSYFLNNLNYIRTFLEEEHIEYLDVSGGIFIFVNISKYNISSEIFCEQFLEKYHVACVPGICFLDDDFIRVNFAVKKEDLVEGLRRFKMYIKELKKD